MKHLLLLVICLLAQPAKAIDYHWNVSPSEAATGVWHGQNLATADFTAGDVLSHVATASPAAYSVATRHQTNDIGAADAETITLNRFACSTGNDTGTGTARFNLVVYEDDADTTAETIASIDFNLATEVGELKQTVTFTTITSAKPYFFAVMLSDGGSVSVTGSTLRAHCQAVWSRS